MTIWTSADSQPLAAINTFAKVVPRRKFDIHVYFFVHHHPDAYRVSLVTFFEGSNHTVNHGVIADESCGGRIFQSREAAIAEAIRMEPFISNEVRKVFYLVTEQSEKPFQLRPRSVEKKSGSNSRRSANGTR